MQTDRDVFSRLWQAVEDLSTREANALAVELGIEPPDGTGWDVVFYYTPEGRQLLPWETVRFVSSSNRPAAMTGRRLRHPS